MKKTVEVTFRFASWGADSSKVLQDVVDLTTELKAKDSSFDVVNVNIEDEEEDDA